MTDIEWGTVLSLAGLFLIGIGYLARQMNRFRRQPVETHGPAGGPPVERIDQLTERYISHLEHHPRGS